MSNILENMYQTLARDAVTLSKACNGEKVPAKEVATAAGRTFVIFTASALATKVALIALKPAIILACNVVALAALGVLIHDAAVVVRNSMGVNGCLVDFGVTSRLEGTLSLKFARAIGG